MKVLFVCTGNTCRSPMAEALFREMTKSNDLAGEILCLSAGIAAKNGDCATENAVKAMDEIGIDISKHKAKRIDSKHLSAWDAFFVMNDTHAYILTKAGVSHEKIYVPNTVNDPFGQEIEVYRNCRDHLKNELKVFLSKVCVAL